VRRRGVLACTRRYTLTPLCHLPSRTFRPPAASTKTLLREPRLLPLSTGPLLPAVRLADTPRRASQLQLSGPCGSLQPTKVPLGPLARHLGSFQSCDLPPPRGDTALTCQLPATSAKTPLREPRLPPLSTSRFAASIFSSLRRTPQSAPFGAFFRGSPLRAP
jgi:hypothetical protein